MSIIFSDSDVFLHQSIATIQNQIATLNINSDLKNSINDNFKQIKQLILFQQHKLSLLSKHNVLGLISWNPAFEITDWDDTATHIFRAILRLLNKPKLLYVNQKHNFVLQL